VSASEGGSAVVDTHPKPSTPHSVSVVIPVYRGATTLPSLIKELERYRTPQATPDGRHFYVAEVLLVWDRGVDGTDEAIRDLCASNLWLRSIWLSRNFGQHPATLAGMTSSGGEWIVTMDEDGQHDPAHIGRMLDGAYQNRSQLVYAAPSNPPPHSFVRNAASKTAKWLFVHVLTSGSLAAFNSYRLILGEAGRSVAAYTGPDVYLDVALSWVIADAVTCPVEYRKEGRSESGYSYRRLASHFWRLVLSSGTRPLRFVSLFGLFFAVAGFFLSVYAIVGEATGSITVAGWTSVFVMLLIVGGAILFSLGVIAEYVSIATKLSMGKPVYVIVQDPADTFGEPGPASDG
jgi:polyisoprenyl-phosphate glycosyltransferase